MVVGEGKRRQITVVLGCGRGREGGFGDERIGYGISGGGADQVKLDIIQTLSCNLSFGSWGMGVGGSLTVRSLSRWALFSSNPIQVHRPAVKTASEEYG